MFGLTSRLFLQDEEENHGIIAKPYAKVAMVVGVQPSEQDNIITTGELIDFFSGEKALTEPGEYSYGPGSVNSVES